MALPAYAPNRRGQVMEDILAEVITEAVGERCPDFEPDCIGCRAWAEYDRVKGLESENAKLRRDLEFASSVDRREDG